MELERLLPSEIEKRSFEIITEELGDRHFPPGEEPVVKRVIHTTADFDYADQLAFSPRAVEAGLKALRGGATIITDTNMGLAGINKRVLKQFGCEAHCFMADEDVAAAAAARGITRAAASIEKAAALGRDCIFAIGNAPTALLRIYELVTEGRLHPRLIIGVPVGFVNVIQAKEQILTLETTPYIIARGRKGGSSVAAAICNALLYQLSDKR